MDVLVLNQEFEVIGIVDYYVSLIWTERYAEAGDFELYLRSDSSVLGLVKLGFYLWLKGAKMTMIVEKIEIKTDVEDGNEIIITGRSLESILDRRIIWPQTNLDGALTGQIGRLIYDAIIDPPDWKAVDGTTVIEAGTNRKIGNVVYKRILTQAQYDALSTEEKNNGTIYDIVPASADDLAIQNLQLKAQYTGDNLYDTITAVCLAYGLGFRVTLTNENKFLLELYQGIDRSYDQEEQTYVIFSAKFDNLISSNYLESNEALRTVTIVAGEGEGTDRKRVVVASETGSGSGLGRRELFTDARDISSTSGSETITPEAYNYKLQQKGIEDLAENVSITTFEGQVQDGMSFTFGKDYFIGDIVQLVDEYGRDTTVRVTELVRSNSTSGLEIYPTFVSTYKAKITILGNAGDIAYISGSGYGYGITIPDTKTITITITATGDYEISGKLTNVKHTVKADTTALAYSVDVRFVATLNLITNPSTLVNLVSDIDADDVVLEYYWLIIQGKKTISEVPQKYKEKVQKLIDENVTYQGTSDSNGAVTFVCYRIGVYNILTPQTVIDDPDDHSGTQPIDYTKLSTWPVSKTYADLDYFDPSRVDQGGKVYTGYSVYVYDLQSPGSQVVDRQSSPTSVYLYWDQIQNDYSSFYTGVEIWQSTINYPDTAVYDPDTPDYTQATKIYSGYGNYTTISEQTKLAYTVTGLSYDTTYYWSIFPFITINGVNYYGEKKTTSQTLHADST